MFGTRKRFGYENENGSVECNVEVNLKEECVKCSRECSLGPRYMYY
jgi:hypothetical protein